MSNLRSNNLHLLKLRINKSEYWDFQINHEYFGNGGSGVGDSMSEECLSSFIDLSNRECVSGDTWIVGHPDYTWENAVSVGKTLKNISYTGIDNGLFTYRKDRIMNKDFVEILKNSTYDLIQDDYRLKMHAVSGNTLEYEYPLHVGFRDTTFNGGFFQGFFETKCDEYAILPSKLHNEDVWEFEFELNHCELEPESDKTLNDKHPDNKGIFFFLGARAENKFIYTYDKDDKEGKEACLQLGIGDFVEGGDIDKKEYVISNFINANPDWDYYNPIDDYVSNDYFDPSLYEYDGSDDYTDAIDFSVFETQPKLIDETLEHEAVGMCNCQSKIYEYSTVSYGCGCCCPRKIVVKKKEVEMVHDGYHDFLFGGDYLDGLDEFADCDIDYLEEDLDLTDFKYYTDNGFDLDVAGYYYIETDNKFLMFDRTCDGYTTNNWVEGTTMMYYGRKNKFKQNLFLLMNRTCTGYSVNNIQKLIDEANQDYDVYKDIYNNALAFRIKDDGSIGYRFLTKDCSISGNDKTSIVENYSAPGVIPSCEYATVHVRLSCVADKMMFEFFVNGKLVYITDWIPKLDMKKLDELNEKQEGVPYNISLGGGTQGLADVVQSNYYLPPSRLYPLEEYFAGTFIGKIKSFKFYTCKQEYEQIVGNYNFEKKRHYMI